MMRAPDFFSRSPPSAAARLLRPAAALYGAVSGWNMRRDGVRATVPVLCVGNFTAGGAGKTPTALAVAAILAEAGERPAFLTRGYGGRLAGPLLVDPERHGWREVGDEALLLAAGHPTILARDRPGGATLATGTGAGVVVMDDGFQNPSLAKDVALVAVDAGAGLGNGLVLPAGPLRAPMVAQWERADAIVVIGEGNAGDGVAREADRRGLAVLRARLVPDPGAAAALCGRRVLAFAGIGRPRKFFDSLAACGADVEVRRSFPDHHPYSTADVDALLREARAGGLLPVTTAKDRVRLPAALDAVTVLPVSLAFDDGTAARDFVTSRIAAARRG